MNNYYELLGVSNNSSNDEIKKAWRSMSLKYHPDRNKTNEAVDMIRKINEAYEVLGDKFKRSQYDMQMNGMGIFGGLGGLGGIFQGKNMGNNVEVHNMDDIFNSLFSGMGGMQGMAGMAGMGEGGPEIHIFNGGFGSDLLNRLQKPTPIIKNIEISLENSYFGCVCEKEIEIWVVNGNKKIYEKKYLEITIPPGISDNEIIILRERGNEINENSKGDVKIIVSILPDERFTREGLDLVYKKRLTLKEALCGFDFELEHLNKQKFLFNNKNKKIIISEGYRKTIPELGFRKESNYGNLILEFSIKFPESLSEDQISNLEKIL